MNGNGNNNIKIDKSLIISWVVITSDNIRELAEKVYDEYNQDLIILENDPHANKSISFILRGSDGTKYESDHKDIFSKGGLLDSRRISAVEMNYFNFTLKKTISIKFTHTINHYFNENIVDISGYDEVWVNGFIKLIESNVSNWKQQEKWPDRFKWPLTILFAIGFGLLFINLLSFTLYFFNIEPITQKPEWIVLLITNLMFYIFAFYIGLLPSYYIVDKIHKLFPVVEFIMGPEYLRIEERRRNKLYQFIIIGIIPLILSLLIELSKYLL